MDNEVSGNEVSGNEGLKYWRRMEKIKQTDRTTVEEVKKTRRVYLGRNNKMEGETVGLYSMRRNGLQFWIP